MSDTTATIPTQTRIAASREPNALLVELTHLIRRHYRGVLFFRDPRATTNNSGNPSVSLNGGAYTLLEGGMYFPNSYVRFNGGDQVSPSLCTVLVGGTHELSGNGVRGLAAVIADGSVPLPAATHSQLFASRS